MKRPGSAFFCLLLALGVASRGARADRPLAESLAALDRQIERTPGDAALWLRRAELTRLDRSWDASLHAVDRASELGLAAGEAERQRGETLLAAGRVVAAETSLRRARDAVPDDAATLLAHARALAALARFADAAHAYDRVVALAPRSTPDVHLERVRAHAAAGAVDAALSAAAEAEAAIGPVPAIEQAALEAELRDARFGAAIARIGRTIAARPGDPSLALQRAQILERSGRLDEANEAYRATLRAIDAMQPVRRTTPMASRSSLEARQGLERLATLDDGSRR